MATTDKPTHTIALTTLLALTSALAAAPLFGAARGGVVGYNQRWAFQRGTDPVTDLYSTSAGYAGYTASRGAATGGDLWDLNRASGGVGTALGAWLGGAAAAAAALAVLALLGRARGPALVPVSLILGGGLLATLAVFYAIVGSALARNASSPTALGKRPPMWPNWGWITGALSGIGWLLAPVLARGLGAGPPGGLFGQRATNLDGGADDATAAAAAAKLAAAERGESGGLPPSASARSGGGGGGGGLTAAAAATTAAAGAAAAAARRSKPAAVGGAGGAAAASADAPKPAGGDGAGGLADAQTDAAAAAPAPQKSGSFLSRAFSRGGASKDEGDAPAAAAAASDDVESGLIKETAAAGGSVAAAAPVAAASTDAPAPAKSGSFLSRAFSRSGGGSKSEDAEADSAGAAAAAAAGTAAVAAGAATAAAAANAGGSSSSRGFGATVGRLLSLRHSSSAEADAVADAAATPADPNKIKRLFSRSASVVEAEGAAKAITAAAFAKAGLPPPSKDEAASLAAVAVEAADLQARVDAVVAGAAAAAAADLQDAKATAIELKRALTLELAPGQKPGGASEVEALAAGAVAAADAAKQGQGVQGAASTGAAAYKDAKGKGPASRP